jgi:hypothetical protein
MAVQGRTGQVAASRRNGAVTVIAITIDKMRLYTDLILEESLEAIGGYSGHIGISAR